MYHKHWNGKEITKDAKTPPAAGTKSGDPVRVEVKVGTKGVARSLSCSPVQSAIDTLLNTGTRVVEEEGGAPKVTWRFNADVMTMLKNMFHAGKTYRFELHSLGTLSTSGAGTFAAALSASPGSTSFAEWSALLGLFDECRLRGSKLVTSSLGFTPPVGLSSIIVAFDQQNISTAPTTPLQVMRIAGSRPIHCWLGDKGSGTSTFTVGSYGKKGSLTTRLWAEVSTPAVQSPMTGMVGAWDIITVNAGTASAAIINYFVSVDVELRSRA
jgi:hypothetical protein